MIRFCSLVLCVLVACYFVSRESNADCGGLQVTAVSCSGSQAKILRATPIRTLIAARPLVGTLQKIQASAQSNRAARAASCSGERTAASCSGPQSVAPQSAAPCPCTCRDCNCNSSMAPSPDSVSVVNRSQPRLVSSVSSAYQQALASAQYRAANRIHGHSPLDTHRTSGVGWASSNSTPTTCLGRGGDSYAVVQGSDGWYATKFQ